MYAFYIMAIVEPVAQPCTNSNSLVYPSCLSSPFIRNIVGLVMPPAQPVRKNCGTALTVQHNKQTKWDWYVRLYIWNIAKDDVPIGQHCLVLIFICQSNHLCVAMSIWHNAHLVKTEEKRHHLAKPFPGLLSPTCIFILQVVEHFVNKCMPSKFMLQGDGILFGWRCLGLLKVELKNFPLRVLWDHVTPQNLQHSPPFLDLRPQVHNFINHISTCHYSVCPIRTSIHVTKKFDVIREKKRRLPATAIWQLPMFTLFWVNVFINYLCCNINDCSEDTPAINFVSVTIHHISRFICPIVYPFSRFARWGGFNQLMCTVFCGGGGFLAVGRLSAAGVDSGIANCGVAVGSAAVEGICVAVYCRCVSVKGGYASVEGGFIDAGDGRAVVSDGL